MLGRIPTPPWRNVALWAMTEPKRVYIGLICGSGTWVRVIGVRVVEATAGWACDDTCVAGDSETER